MRSEGTSVAEHIDDLFRRESGRLLAALVRLLGPNQLALAEDVVQDALVSAVQSWRFGLPDRPTSWLAHVARNRAIDILRRDRRFDSLSESPAAESVTAILSPDADAENQLNMMFAICDDALSPETHVTLMLRWLCGFSAHEIASAFLVDTQTIDRRLHRGRTRLEELGTLGEVTRAEEVIARQPSVEQALYLLFNEGYHGSERTLHPAMCADALRLVELLLSVSVARHSSAHALAALFCFTAARLTGRLSPEGVVVPLAEQDRGRWDRSLVDRGIVHLGESADGDRLTRWHLEAGISFEHTTAESAAQTNWTKILRYYDALLGICPGPVVAMNHALASAEVHGLDAGRSALASLEGDPKLAAYSFYWAARADIERRSGRGADAEALYLRAIALARSDAERRSYETRCASNEPRPEE
jgi:RNA polymerase sigma-70 factor (ECF subfamily)